MANRLLWLGLSEKKPSWPRPPKTDEQDDGEMTDTMDTPRPPPQGESVLFRFGPAPHQSPSKPGRWPPAASRWPSNEPYSSRPPARVASLRQSCRQKSITCQPASHALG